MKKGNINKKMVAFALGILMICGTILYGCSFNSSPSQETQKELSKGVDDKALFTYLEKNDFNRVQELLDLGVSPNIKNASLQTPLMIAVTKGDSKLVKLLLSKNANIEVTHKLDGKTALMIAVNNNYKDIVQTLIEKGANINHKDIYGETALTIAKKKGFKDIANILVITNLNKDAAPLVEIRKYQNELHERVADINEAIERLEKMSTTNTITLDWLTKAQSEMDIISANITILSQSTPPNGYMRIDELIRKSFDSFNYAQKSLERIFVVKDESSKRSFIAKLKEGKEFLRQGEKEINL